MTPEFLAAVIDTLLPDEQASPSGTRAGLDPRAYVAPHRAVFDAIAAQAGSSEPFLRADEKARMAILQAVERAVPDAFRALLVTALTDYYEAPAVLTALGWRTDPPQPAGHAVLKMDDPTAARLERVRRRARLWRTA
jgi:hypothetical protein